MDTDKDETIARTYRIERRVDEWVEDVSDDNDCSKSEVVERAMKVYAAMYYHKDKKWEDEVDEQFEDTMRDKMG